VAAAAAAAANEAIADEDDAEATSTRWRLAPPITTKAGMCCAMAYSGMTLRADEGGVE